MMKEWVDTLGVSPEKIRVCLDSRQISHGDVFFAVKGEKVDSHLFIPDVVRKGASAVVVDHSFPRKEVGIPLVFVPNVVEFLQLLAKEKLKSWDPKIVGVTGSVGKTTTKGFIATLLSEKYLVGSSVGNRNSQLGLPLTILNDIKGNEEILVLEMGMDQPGQIKRLTEIAPPHISVITAVELVHAFHFNSLEEIALAKAEILEHPRTREGFIPNIDILYKVGSCKKTCFSATNSCFIDYSSIKVKHLEHNVLAAIAVARTMGLTDDELREGLSKLILPEGRLQVVQKRGVTFVNDAYNACVASVKGALSCLPEPVQGGKRIAVLGEMKELGQFSKQCHEEVAEESLIFVDAMVCLGEECEPIYRRWKKAKRPVFWLQTLAEVIQVLRQLMHRGDVILLKGSQSTGIHKVIEEV